MAGIVKDEMQPPVDDASAPAQAPEPPAEQAADTGPENTPKDDAQDQVDGNSNVTPEEQKQYDQVVTAALQNIYSKEGFPAVIAKLGSFHDRPAYGIGHTGAMVLLSVKKSIEQQGGQVADDVLFAAGQEIISDLTEVAVGANVITQDQQSKVGEEAFYEGLKVWGQTMKDTGQITPDIAAQAANDLRASGHPVPTPPADQSAPPAPTNTPAPAGIVNQAGA